MSVQSRHRARRSDRDRRVADAYDRLAPGAYGLALRMLGSEDDAVAVVQDAFVMWGSGSHDESLLPERVRSLCLTRLRARSCSSDSADPVAMAFFDGMRAPEIARALDLGVVQVHGLLRSGLRTLAARSDRVPRQTVM